VSCSSDRKAEVTSAGQRPACAPIRNQPAAQRQHADRRDADPRPQGLGAAAAQLRAARAGHRNLFVNVNYFVTGGGSRDDLHARQRQQRRGWGRQTMIATVPVGAIQKSRCSQCVLRRVRLDRRPALNIVTKSGTNDVHGEGLYGAARQLAGGRSRPPASARRRSRAASRRRRSRVNPADVRLGGPVLRHRRAPFVKDKTFFFATGDYTLQDRTTFHSASLRRS
jgi:hypothetical protein